MSTLTRRTALALPLALGLAPREGWAQQGPINLGMIGPLTGPFAFTGQREIMGWQDAIDYVNANGGAEGRKLALMTLELRIQGRCRRRTVEESDCAG